MVTITKKQIIDRIVGAMPGDLKPFAKAIVPVLADMVDKQGLDEVRRFLFVYRGNDRSWDKKLARNMTVRQRIKWRQAMSDKRIAELEEVKVMRMKSTALRRLLVQRIMTKALEIAIGAL